VTLDLGKVVYTRTDGANNPGVMLITSGNDEYRLEYSTDGISWTLWKEVPQLCGCSELESNHVFAPNVAGRYFRIYHPSGTPGDGKYSVAQFVFIYALTANGTQTFSAQNARAFGPEALATNAEFAPAGTSWNDSRYATVIPGAGKGFGLIIDMGNAAGRGITRVKLQADANDTYVVLISTDALDWEILYIANPVSGSGLQIRDSGDTLRDFNGKPWVGRYIWVYASTGDGNYSVSEIEIFNDILAAGCPFDATANSIALGSAQCSYSGDVLANAAMPSGTALTVDLDDVTVTARCNPPLFPSYDIQLYPLFSGSTSGQCNFTPVGLEADVNFCAVTCSSSSAQPVELTYMQVNGQPEISPPLDQSQCSTDAAYSSPELQADVTTAIELSLTDLLTAAILDVQNALLRQNSPFPGETLSSGTPAVCTP
jgi:hypothetical protein